MTTFEDLYQKESLDESFAHKAKRKLAKVARTVGKKMVHQLLVLFYTLMQKNLPAKLRRLILATLAYFVMPFDAVPDFLFGAGYTDDWLVLSAAFGTVYLYSTPETRKRAGEVAEFLFAK